MTDVLERVVVPYAEFLERRARRGRVTAEIVRQDAEPPAPLQPAGLEAGDGEAIAIAMQAVVTSSQRRGLTDSREQ